MVEAIAEN